MKMSHTNMDYRHLVLKYFPESYHKRFEEEKKYLKEKITPNAEVLEVGCGDGRSIFDLLTITKNVTGIDHDDKAIVDSKKNFSEYPSIKIIKADAASMPFKDSNFDFVICMTTFANFAEKKLIILEEMKRVLKNNGKIIISVFSETALEERMKVYKKVGAEIKEILDGTVTFDEKLGDNISEQFSKDKLEGIFSQVGLQVEEIRKVDIAYLVTVTK